jgi:hypothetical protein
VVVEDVNLLNAIVFFRYCSMLDFSIFAIRVFWGAGPPSLGPLGAVLAPALATGLDAE